MCGEEFTEDVPKDCFLLEFLKSLSISEFSIFLPTEKKKRKKKKKIRNRNRKKKSRERENEEIMSNKVKDGIKINMSC